MKPSQSPDDPEAFAARLRAQPAAGLPGHWRGEILAAAMAAARLPGPCWRRAAEAFGAWLWPHPLAYAGLLTVWVAIGTLRLLTPGAEPGASSASSARVAMGPADPAERGLIFERMRLASREAAFLKDYTDVP